MQRVLPLLAAAALTGAPGAAALRLSGAGAAEADDVRYLQASYVALQHELHQLASASSLLQLPAKGAPVNSSKVAVKIGNTSAKPAEKAVTVAVKDGNIATKLAANAAVSAAISKAQSTAALAPMLAMLKGLYEEQKGRIGELNKREQKSKERFEKQKKEFDAKQAHLKDLHDHHKLSDEFYKNETSDGARMFKYWEKSRDRNHKQFHNSLKLTHATMEKEKTMIQAYENAMSTKPADKAKGAKEFAKIEQQAMPEVVFLQGENDAIGKFCTDALDQVSIAVSELFTMLSNSADAGTTVAGTVPRS